MKTEEEIVGMVVVVVMRAGQGQMMVTALSKVMLMMSVTWYW